MTANEIHREMQKLGTKKRAKALQWFFKTGPGEYAEGDIFLGLTVPQIRALTKEYCDLPMREVQRLLRSRFHEERMLALVILVRAFAKGSEVEKKRIWDLYFANTRFINNWDLVDVSAGKIVGAFLADKSKAPLYRLARSRSLWERRIAIISTCHFIAKGKFGETLKIAKLLLRDEHDLVHKAVGWMLREVGKRNLAAEEKFLRRHYRQMPRTMLRYAIERLPEARRQCYLKGTINGKG